MNSSACAAGELRDEVIGVHGLFAVRRDLPEVFLVVEHRRVGHVEGREHPRLDLEQRPGIADVPPEVGRHFGDTA